MNRTKTEPEREAEASGALSKRGHLQSGKTAETRGPVASLHRSVGNQAFQALHGRGELSAKHRGDRPNEEYGRNSGEFRTGGRGDGSAGEVTRNRERRRLQEEGVIQPKLEVSNPDDPHEREARRVADQVMKMPDPTERAQVEEEAQEAANSANVSTVGDVISRVHPMLDETGAPVELTSVDRIVMGTPDVHSRQQGSEGGSVSTGVERRIRSKKGGGRSMTISQRSFFEPRFGRDFGDVRIHTDSEANRLTRSLGARAFSSGNDIFFGSGEYQPNSTEGKELMAHELTHTIQDEKSSTNAIQQQPPRTLDTSITEQGDPSIVSRIAASSVAGIVGAAISVASATGQATAAALEGDFTDVQTMGQGGIAITNIREYMQGQGEGTLNELAQEDDFHSGQTMLDIDMREFGGDLAWEPDPITWIPTEGSDLDPLISLDLKVDYLALPAPDPKNDPYFLEFKDMIVDNTYDRAYWGATADVSFKTIAGKGEQGLGIGFALNLYPICEDFLHTYWEGSFEQLILTFTKAGDGGEGRWVRHNWDTGPHTIVADYTDTPN